MFIMTYDVSIIYVKAYSNFMVEKLHLNKSLDIWSLCGKIVYLSLSVKYIWNVLLKMNE